MQTIDTSVAAESKLGYFLKNGFFVSLEKTILIGKGIFISYLLANYVERNVLGSYQYVVAFFGLVSVVSFPGMGTAVVQAVARGFEGTLFVGVRASLKRSFVGAFLLCILAFYYFYTKEYLLSWAFLLIATVSPFSIVVSFLRQYYAAKEDFFLMVKTTLLTELITLFSFSAAIIFFPNILGLLAGSVVISSLIGLVWMIPLLRKARYEADEVSNIEYGKKLSWSYIISIISANADKIILSHFLGFSDLALYAIAMIIPEQTRSSLVAIPLLLMPKFSREDGGGYGRRFAAQVFFVSWMVVGLIFLVYYFLAPFIFSFLFPQYLDAVQMSRMLFLVIFSIPFLVLDTYYRSRKSEKVIFQSTLLGSIGGIGLMPIFILSYGVYGAIFAKLTGYFLNSVFLAFCFFFRNK